MEIIDWDEVNEGDENHKAIFRTYFGYSKKFSTFKFLKN